MTIESTFFRSISVQIVQKGLKKRSISVHLRGQVEIRELKRPENGACPFTCLTGFSYLCVKESKFKDTLVSTLATPSFPLSAAHGESSEIPQRSSGWHGKRIGKILYWILFGGFRYYSYFCHRKTWVRLCTSFVFRRYKNLKPSNALIANMLCLCVRKRSFVCNINFKNSCWVLCLQKTVWLIRGRFFDPFLIKGLKYPVRNKSH